MDLELVAFCSEIALQDGNVPEWIHLLPLDEDVKGRDGRAWKLLDAKAVATRSRSQRLMLDYEHASEADDDSALRAEAAGWIRELRVAENADEMFKRPGTWGRVDWTERGRADVSKGGWFISPAFHFRPDTREIVRLVSAGLTKNPNLDLTALNRSRAAKGAAQENNMNELLKAVCTRLGLPADTTETGAITALNSRLASTERERDDALEKARNADVRVVEMNEKLSARDAADHEKALNAALDEACKDGRLTPGERDVTKALCTRENFAAWKEALDRRPKVIVDQRPANTTSDGKTITALNATQKAFCERSGMDEAEYLAVLNERAKEN